MIATAFFGLLILTISCQEYQLIEQLNRIDINGGFNWPDIFDGNVNINDPDNNHYSIIGTIGNMAEYFRGASDGKFQFKLIYDNADGSISEIIWKQSSWIQQPSITGFESINMPNFDNPSDPGLIFNGLGLSAPDIHTYSETYLDGNGNDDISRWNSIGTIDSYNDGAYTGIAAYGAKIAYSERLYIAAGDTFSQNIWPSGYFKLQNKLSTNCIFSSSLNDIFGYESCVNDLEDQLWTKDGVNGNYFRLKNKNSNKCLVNRNHGAAEGVGYVESPFDYDGFAFNDDECTDLDDELWSIYGGFLEGMYFMIRNKHTNLCIYQNPDGRFGISGCNMAFHDQYWRVIPYHSERLYISGEADTEYFQLILQLNDIDINGGFNSEDIKDDGNVNIDDAVNNHYSIIGVTGDKKENFRGNDNKFKFKLIYDNADGTQDIIIWKQSSWIEEESISGFESISQPVFNNPSNWGLIFNGLGITNRSETYLDGNGNDHFWWWNSVGTINEFNGGIPAYGEKIAHSQRLYISVELERVCVSNGINAYKHLNGEYIAVTSGDYMDGSLPLDLSYTADTCATSANCNIYKHTTCDGVDYYIGLGGHDESFCITSTTPREDFRLYPNWSDWIDDINVIYQCGGWEITNCQNGHEFAYWGEGYESLIITPGKC